MPFCCARANNLAALPGQTQTRPWDRAIELLHIECVPLHPVSQKVSPQNGGFIRAKLTRPRIFCYKNNVRNIQNGGFIRAKSGLLIRHQARMLYLLILLIAANSENTEWSLGNEENI